MGTAKLAVRSMAVIVAPLLLTGAGVAAALTTAAAGIAGSPAWRQPSPLTAL
jgi:hypothetical protein